MKFCKRWAVILMCLAALLSFFGCTVKKPHMVDGPGMENTDYWVSFTVSRSDSYAQHNFSITVEETADGYAVSGTLRDDDGTEYSQQSPVPIPVELYTKLQQLRPDRLTDVTACPDDPDGAVALDAPQVYIEVVYSTGTRREKADNNDFSLEVYQLVLPFFREKSK